ncbi:hypothetical protein ACFE04_020782 [Oxalis oulophora]
MEYASNGEVFERICNVGRFSEDEMWLRIPLTETEKHPSHPYTAHRVDSWNIWDVFRLLCGHHPCLSVLLEIPPALELPEKDNPGTYISRDEPFQQNEMENPLINVDIDDAPQALINIDVDEVELDSESGDESDDESELHSEDDNDLSMTDEENEVDFDNNSE